MQIGDQKNGFLTAFSKIQLEFQKKESYQSSHLEREVRKFNHCTLGADIILLSRERFDINGHFL